MVSRNARRKPTLEGPPRWRFISVLAVLLLAPVAIILRALDLQVIDSEHLRSEAQARHLHTVEMRAHRGEITDRHGEPLAVSSPIQSAWVHPAKLLGDEAALKAVASALERSAQGLRSYLQARRDREFVYLERHLAPATADRLARLEAPGLHLREESQRFYPAGKVAAQVVGFTDIDGRGLAGAELAFDEALSGRDGAKRVIRDRHGRTVEGVGLQREPQAGEDVALALDRHIQYIAYRELERAVASHDAAAASAVVLDATTGEVLAMANQPSFNPHRRSGLGAEELRNRAAAWTQEPGSLIKPFTVAAALSSGAIREDRVLETSPGTFQVGDHTVRDIADHGSLDVAGVIKESSNIGAAKIALATEPRALWEGLQAFGFGARTRSGLAGESSGIFLPAPPRGDVQRATLSYGYGVTATPLQLARAYAALAQGGVIRPASIRALEAPPEGRRILDAELARRLRRMLEGVVAPGGTGTQAAIPGYRVAGKTGTVHKSGPGGYAEEDYIASFVGFVPASDPRLVMAVTIDEPRSEEYYGGQVAAPVFSRVMSEALRILNIPPDGLSPRDAPAVAEEGAS